MPYILPATSVTGHPHLHQVVEVGIAHARGDLADGFLEGVAAREEGGDVAASETPRRPSGVMG